MYSCMYAWMFVCASGMCSAQWGQKSPLDPLKLKLEAAVSAMWVQDPKRPSGRAAHALNHGVAFPAPLFSS